MMKYNLAFFPLMVLILGGCDVKSGKKPDTPAQNTQPAFITGKSVWKGNLDKCFTDNVDNSCLINEIKKNGSAEAVKAAQYLAKKGENGYVTSFTKEGSVGIAGVEYPFRANTNSGNLLVPSIGQPIDIDNIYDTLSANQIWLDFEKKHPDSMPWAPAILRKKESTDNGIELIFSYPIKTCHACETIASLYISYKFTTEGEFINKTTLEIK